MKKNNFKLFFAMVTVIMVVLFGSVFTSCSNDDNLLLAGGTQTEKVSSLDVDSVKGMTRGMTTMPFGYTYYPNPSLSYATSSSGDNKPGLGGSYLGGLINATIIENSGNYYVRITFNGGTLNYSGYAAVRIGTLFGGYGSNFASFSSGVSQVDVPVSIQLNSSNISKRGVMNLWPIVVVNIGGTIARFYTYPIMIWTNPLYYSSNTANELNGYVDNVEVRDISGGCSAFCKTYYETLFGMNLTGIGNGGDWYQNASSKNLSYYPNGTMAPQVGDVICWTGGPSPYYGHVALIVEVQSNYVKIAQQGRVNMDPIGKQIARTNSTTLANGLSNIYTLKGLIRKDY